MPGASAASDMPMSRRARRLALSGSAPAAPSAPSVATPPAEAVTEPASVAETRVIEVRTADTEVRTEVIEPAIAEVPAEAAAAAGVPAAVPLETTAAATAPDEPVEPAQPIAPASAARSTADAFARAADAFGFAPVDDATDDSHSSTVDPATDETESDDRESIVLPAADHVAPRRRIRHRIAAAGASIGVMGVASLIAVSMTLPASAVAAVQRGGSGMTASLVAADAPAKKIDEHEIQAFVAAAGVQDEALVRDAEYSTVSLLDVAAEEHIRFSDSLYTNDPNAAIQWPFMVGVAMSSPYGMRDGRLHAGIDLVPGNGATIQAIADGTVRIATESGGAYGVNAYIDHVIDGKVVTSHYAHMQYGSLAVKAGQKVKVGDPIGKVGNTGRSYGAHLHFEIIINGSTVDPLVWLRKNAGRYEY